MIGIKQELIWQPEMAFLQVPGVPIYRKLWVFIMILMLTFGPLICLNVLAAPVF